MLERTGWGVEHLGFEEELNLVLGTLESQGSRLATSGAKGQVSGQVRKWYYFRAPANTILKNRDVVLTLPDFKTYCKGLVEQHTESRNRPT